MPQSKVQSIEAHRKAERAGRSRDDLDSVDDAIADYRRGRCVIVVDDESRENEGDLVIGA